MAKHYVVAEIAIRIIRCTCYMHGVLKTAYVLDKWLLTIIQNEITAFPELLAQLEIQGAVITADAIHTQKASVKVVTEKKADYVFPVKENQSSLLEDIKLLFTEADAVEF